MNKCIVAMLLMLAGISMHAKKIGYADPTILYDNGYYYLSGTSSNSGFAGCRSTDLVHWEPVDTASSLLLNVKDAYGTQALWAPQLFRFGDTCYMAYAANFRIAIAKSDRPEGPYKIATHAPIGFEGEDIAEIDPFVFIDDDGTKYLYYVRCEDANELYVCELTDDFSAVKEGTRTRCFGPELEWETRYGEVVEGPTMFKDGPFYYLLYSGNGYQSPNYAVGYAYSISPRGPWIKTGRPFISRNACGLNGSGHGDMFKDKDGKWNYVFHVHRSDSVIHDRYACIVPLTITDDPNNKFIPQWDRMHVLDNEAHADAALPVAQTSFEVDGICYRTLPGDEKAVEVVTPNPIDFGGYEGDIKIPSTVKHQGVKYNVRAIGTAAFSNCENLHSVTLSKGIRTIGVGAFESSAVESIRILGDMPSFAYRSVDLCDNLKEIVHKKKVLKVNRVAHKIKNN